LFPGYYETKEKIMDLRLTEAIIDLDEVGIFILLIVRVVTTNAALNLRRVRNVTD